MLDSILQQTLKKNQAFQEIDQWVPLIFENVTEQRSAKIKHSFTGKGVTFKCTFFGILRHTYRGSFRGGDHQKMRIFAPKSKQSTFQIFPYLGQRGGHQISVFPKFKRLIYTYGTYMADICLNQSQCNTQIVFDTFFARFIQNSLNYPRWGVGKKILDFFHFQVHFHLDGSPKLVS